MPTGLFVILLVSAVIGIYLGGMLLAYALLERHEPDLLGCEQNRVWAAIWPLWIIFVPIAAAVALVELAMDQIQEHEKKRRNDRHGHN